MKRDISISTRIMTACLIPVVVLFLLLLILITRLVYNDAVESAKEKTLFFSDCIVNVVTSNIANQTDSLILTGTNLSEVDISSPTAQEELDSILYSFLNSNPNLYCTWFAFEQGVFGPERYTKDYIKTEDGIVEIFDLTDELLDDETLSPFYNGALKSGEIFFDNVGFYDYGDGPIGTATISYPIKNGDEVIGVLGMDFLYRDFYSFLDDLQLENEQTVMLLSDTGRILYSSSSDYINKPLLTNEFNKYDKIWDSVEKDGLYISEMISPLYQSKSLVCICAIHVENARVPIYLYVDMPLSALYAQANVISQIILIIGLVIIILLMISIYLTTNAPITAIHNITLKLNKIANGDFNVSFDDNAASYQKNEIFIMQSALEKMSHQIHDYIIEKNKFSATLEATVKERTHELLEMTNKAEEAQKAAEAATDAKSIFLANMSHEIRTPMNAILGLTDLLANEKLSDKQASYVDKIKSSSNILLALINDILDFSKMVSGSFELIHVNFDFFKLLNQIRDMFEVISHNKNISFQIEIADNIPQYLYGDDIRIRQLLTNILSNAIKFTSVGGVQMKVFSLNEMLYFEITDSGIGIREDDLPNLFQTFSQVDTRKNRSVNGSGLGLAICKQIVDLMNGEITVSSEYDNGSTFCIMIPMVIAMSASVPAPSDADMTVELEQSALPVSKNTLLFDASALIVDDNEINLDVAAGILEYFGLKTTLAESGELALSLIQETDFDIIFMDHMMPVMDGVETTISIRNMGGKFAEIPIIALTANALPEAQELFLQSGMNDYILKPIERKRLQDVLQKWLS